MDCIGPEINLCSRFGEICYCCSLTSLPGPAWVVLITLPSMYLFACDEPLHCINLSGTLRRSAATLLMACDAEGKKNSCLVPPGKGRKGCQKCERKERERGTLARHATVGRFLRHARLPAINGTSDAEIQLARQKKAEPFSSPTL